MQLRSLTENIIDTTSPGGKLIYGMFALMAQFERDQGRQRTIAGLAAAKARGRTGGRPKSLNDDDLKTARALMASGDFSFQVVADKVGVARQTLWRALKAADDRQIESHRP